MGKSAVSKKRQHRAESSDASPVWLRRKEQLYGVLSRKPVAGISEEELNAHFDGMPERYWECVTEDELVWGLQTVHRFLSLLVNPTSGAAAVMEVKHFTREGHTRVLVCTWDRLGLLTKIAGYISALRLNVIRAAAFTRADNIVLDEFWISDGQKRVVTAEQLRQLAFLLDGGLSEPPRFASTWAVRSHEFLPRTKRMKPAVLFNNADSLDRTIITVEASERLGLLHDMLEVLSQNGLNVTEALIDTIDDVAHDIFFVTDDHRRKVVEPAHLKRIEEALIQALEH